jgi:hypothetical protein
VSLDAEDLELLRESSRDFSVLLRVTVSGCAYACCGRGWTRRDGYEQDYIGYVNPLDEEPPQVTFIARLARPGHRELPRAIRESEVLGVEVFRRL